MTADPLVLNAEVERATARLLDTAHTLDGAGLVAPSLLPGWTRGHVLTHVARNADALVNLFTWARTGVRTPAYPSRAVRNEAIAAGAGRPLGVQLDDLRSSADRFSAAIEEMPPKAWAAQVELGSGTVVPAARVVWARLCEVEVHHVDLDAGYGPADWAPGFAQRLLHDIPKIDARIVDADTGQTVFAATDSPVVTGPAHLLAAWLIGRSDGTGLRVSPEGRLPSVPDWK